MDPTADRRLPEPAPGCRAEAEALFARGDIEEALACLDRALARWTLPLATLRFREHLLRALPLLGALHPHRELVARDQPSEDADSDLIASSMQLGLFAEAHAQLERAIARQPSVVRHLDRYRVLFELDRVDEAREALASALSLEPTTEERARIAMHLVRVGDLAGARALATETLRAAPHSASAQLAVAWQRLWQGDTTRAALLAREVGDRVRGAARLRAALAFVERRWSEAETEARAAIRAEPDDGTARAFFAAALLRQGQAHAAISEAQRAQHTADGWLHAARLIEIAARARTGDVPPLELGELALAFAPMLGALPVDARPDDAVRVSATLDAAIERLSANFSNAPTYCDAATGRWTALRPALPPRVVCVRTFDMINGRPIPWVAEQLRALHARYPGSPYVHTHAAELLLWQGEYAECERECRAALEITTTGPARWAWVGLGASLMLRGREADALAVLAQSDALQASGAPLLAVRGETLRRMGRLDDAERDLRAALRERPTRTSVWINLGLVAHARGRTDVPRAIHGELARQLPVFVADVTRDLRGSRDARALSADEIPVWLAHALAVMAGNRSSNRITYRLRDGAMRISDARRLEIDGA